LLYKHCSDPALLYRYTRIYFICKKATIFKRSPLLPQNWPTFLYNFWFRVRGIQKYTLRNGLQLLIREGTDDRYIFNEMAVHRIYTPPGFEIKSTDTVIDIGGHIGTFSLLATKQAKQGKVLCYEPNADNFKLLQKNASLNSFPQLSIENKAVSRKKGVSIFYSDTTYRSGRHSLYKNMPHAIQTEVQTTTLPEIVNKHQLAIINFLKLDCEGAEYDILYNCPKKILQRIQKIALENHYISEEKNAERLHHFLEKNGFQVFRPRKHPELLFATKSAL
jgi:FkbM family methyltransferase